LGANGHRDGEGEQQVHNITEPEGQKRASVRRNAKPGMTTVGTALCRSVASTTTDTNDTRDSRCPGDRACARAETHDTIRRRSSHAMPVHMSSTQLDRGICAPCPTGIPAHAVPPQGPPYGSPGSPVSTHTAHEVRGAWEGKNMHEVPQTHRDPTEWQPEQMNNSERTCLCGCALVMNAGNP
jgi:hypothetical protein